MKKADYLIKSFINAGAVCIYVYGVVWLMFNAERFFDNGPELLVPLFALLLFIISATVTSLLVLGRPIQLYLSGHKKEGFMLLFSTLAWLVLFLIVIVIKLVVQ